MGTLGTENFSSIHDSIHSFFKSKRPKKIFIVGDFNLSSVTWPLDNTLPCDSIEKKFTDTFCELGLTQCIDRPTHSKGRVLDLLLTSHKQLIDNLEIHDKSRHIVQSDHFPITFDVKTKLKHVKGTKRKCYNFKRADWEALNYDMCRVNWNDLLDSTELEIAWHNFKRKLFYYVNIAGTHFNLAI